jgi:hypothetical protein
MQTHAEAATIVTRRAPPFHRAPNGDVVLVEDGAPFVRPFVSHRFFAFGEPLSLGAPVAIIEAPYFCYLDGLGFADQAAFVRHLHDAHGVPVGRALSFCEQVGGRYVFFGF